MTIEPSPDDDYQGDIADEVPIVFKNDDQRTFFSAVCNGMTVEQAADSVGKGRSTGYRWAKERGMWNNPTFAQSHNTAIAAEAHRTEEQLHAARLKRAEDLPDIRRRVREVVETVLHNIDLTEPGVKDLAVALKLLYDTDDRIDRFLGIGRQERIEILLSELKSLDGSEVEAAVAILAQQMLGTGDTGVGEDD